MNLAGNISRSPITMRCTQVFSTNKTVRHDITEKIVESGINIDSRDACNTSKWGAK
jgi:hypothetical protein